MDLQGPDFSGSRDPMIIFGSPKQLRINPDTYIYRIALLALGMLHCSCVCMVAQLHALRSQQNKHLLSVEFA